LVSNCDCLRYICQTLSIPVTATPSVISLDDDIGDYSNADYNN
jgi:hypothetical protein